MRSGRAGRPFLPPERDKRPPKGAFPPSGTPLDLSAFSARLALIPAPQQATGEAAGDYSHRPVILFRRAALLLARHWQAGILLMAYKNLTISDDKNVGDTKTIFFPLPVAALTTRKNPTTGDDESKKDSKGALSLAVPGSRSCDIVALLAVASNRSVSLRQPLFRKKSRFRCLSPCKRGLYTAAGSLPTFCEDAHRQKGTQGNIFVPLLMPKSNADNLQNPTTGGNES